MKNSGLSMIGMLVSLLVIAVLTILVMKNMGINGSKNPEKNIKAPMEKAKSVECTLKVEGLNKEVETYKITNEKFPESLDELGQDYQCPVYKLAYHYDPITGKVWCPKHDRD